MSVSGLGYDPRRTVLSALKAGAYVTAGLLINDPAFFPGLVTLIPDATLRMVVAMFVPTFVAALQNWLRNRSR